MLPTWTLPQDKNIGVQLMSLTLLLALTGKQQTARAPPLPERLGTDARYDQ